MSPMQQMFLGLGAVVKKTYIDDVFSTFLYKGNDGTNSIVNNIDLASEGGMVWFKDRTVGYFHVLYDTERGAAQNKAIYPDNNVAAGNYSNNANLTIFNNNGFSL